MGNHTLKQQLVFLQWINNLIKDDFLTMEIRQRLKGEDVSFKKYLRGVPTPSMSEQKGYDMLWTYIKRLELRNENLQNAIKDVKILIECYADKQYLIDQLNKKLKKINIPTL